MRFAYVIATALILAVFGLSANFSQIQAAQLPVDKAPANATQSLLDKVQYYGRRCRRVRRRCRRRFGAGRRYRRCVRRRDCRVVPRRVRRCVRIRRRCRLNFGRGRDYRFCVRRRGCRL